MTETPARSSRALEFVEAVLCAGRTWWRCRCACGKERLFLPARVRDGHNVRCGRACTIPMVSPNKTHGQTRTPLYRTWSNMLSRCYNPKVPEYRSHGARGIRVCDAWRSSYEAFAAAVGTPPTPKHTIDRYPDKNGNYEPGNVRWATQTEQQRNRRDNVVYTHEGITCTLAEWAERLEVPYKTLHTWRKKYPTDFAKIRECAARFKSRKQRESKGRP